MIITIGVRVLKGVNFHIMRIFQNEGLERKGELTSIEDQNRANQNSEKDFKAGRVSYDAAFLVYRDELPAKKFFQ